MATLKEIRQQVLDLSDGERINLARNCASELRNALDSRSQFIDLMRMITRVFVSADRNCDRYEYEIYCEATGDRPSWDEFFNFTNYGSNSQAVNDLLAFCAKIHEDYRNAIALYGCCLMAHDGTLTVAEQDIFNKVLGY